jgi:hypothetical protein
MCKLCYNDPATREQYKRHSEELDNEVFQSWRWEPCLFECGMDVDREKYLTIEESIANNFWEENVLAGV